MDDGRERAQLLQRLRDAGLSEKEIERTAAEGRIATLAVEIALGVEERHTLTTVAKEGGVPTAYARELLRAFGRPDPGRAQRALSDEDLELARIVRALIDAGVPRQDVVELARVIGQSMSQTAEAVRRVLGNALIRPGDSEYAVGVRFATAAEQFGPLMPRLLDFAFRAHLRDLIQQQILTEAEREAGQLAETTDVAVAFADLVAYTKLGERLPAEDLGQLAGRFAELAVTAAVPPTRLVKTIGDAAMYVATDPAAMVKTLERLCRSVDEAKPEMPTVRAGIAWGPATTRGGDWFGATVNLASRIAGAAKPGQILASEALVEQAHELEWKRRRKLRLKGVEGRVRLFSYG